MSTSGSVLTEVSLCCSEVLKAYFVQLAVLANFQNGRDTHIRQIKVFGPRNDSLSALTEDIAFYSTDVTMYASVR